MADFAPAEAVDKSISAKSNPYQRDNFLKIFFLILCIVFGFIVIYLTEQNVWLRNENSKLEIQSISVQPTIKSSNNSYCPSITQQAEQNKFLNHLSTAIIFDNGDLYSKLYMLENGMETYNDSYSFVFNGQSYEAYISIFRNFAGKTTQEQYEGMKPVIRNYDLEKEMYLMLNEGKYQENMWGVIDYGKYEVTVKKIGKEKFVIYDTAFGPSGTVSRVYLIYSEKSKNLVYFGLTSYYGIQDTKISNENGVRVVQSYPANFQKFINQVESSIANYKLLVEVINISGVQ